MSHREVVVPAGARDVGFLNQRQHAEVSLAFTETAGLKAGAQITNGGLLSIAALVSTILLSTAVLVHVATRDTHSKRLW
ncbi:hypothetical protein KX729_27610 [Rhizobium sp. XQZ8]|uniref:hypothetical protein n=1 Tax=Rhizobium populisoli TaxID=2859785 RepID=UPI001CA4B7E7|nr:hypothetical protein [Rhizobium populisoli]MBW6425207.1 hypothetical protein [Rhizobium populisoli]